jgi:ankyrin repeat protein
MVIKQEHSYRENDSFDKYVELQLAHSSVKEYLTSGQLEKNIAHNFQEIAAKASIATVCLAYLLHLDGELNIKGIKERYPFAQYCARYWMSHAAVAEDKDKRLQGFIEKFFCHHERSYKTCYTLYRPDRPWVNALEEERDEPASALYYAALGGLLNAVDCLLSKGADVNAQGGYFGTALQVASLQGHEKVVKMLLDKAADVNAQSGYFGTALHAASLAGHEKLVELLLDKGAHVNAQDGESGTPLYAASASALSESHLLHDKGGYVIKPRKLGTALHAASLAGHEKVVKMLLDKGADINAQGGSYGTALYAASLQGHEKVVELLLGKGADVNAEGGYYGTALHGASARGNEKVVELLVGKGADVNALNGGSGTPLYAASARGHEKVVELLLGKGADVNAISGRYGTALYVASYKGH